MNKERVVNFFENSIGELMEQPGPGHDGIWPDLGFVRSSCGSSHGCYGAESCDAFYRFEQPI